MKNLKTGDKLVCVTKDWDNTHDNNPVYNKDYVVRDVEIQDGEIIISLMEFPKDCFFLASGFKTLDYEFVTKLLAKISNEQLN